jgi:hypothetical protein
MAKFRDSHLLGVLDQGLLEALRGRAGWGLVDNWVLRVNDHRVGDHSDGKHRAQVNWNAKEKPAEDGREHELERTGERLQDRVEGFQKEAGDDANGGVVQHDREHRGPQDGGQSIWLECLLQVSLHHQDAEVADDRVHVHEDVLHIDVDLCAFALQQEFVVDAREAGAHRLKQVLMISPDQFHQIRGLP